MTVKIDFIPISTEILDLYLKRLSYIPKHWNAENICNKKIQMLTQDELVIASYILNDKILIDLINDYKQEPTFEKHRILSDKLNSYNYQLCVNIKLSQEELHEIYQTINSLTIEEKQNRRKKLLESDNLSFKEEYELHLIENKLIQELNNTSLFHTNPNTKIYAKKRNNPQNKPKY